LQLVIDTVIISGVHSPQLIKMLLMKRMANAETSFLIFWKFLYHSA